MQQAGVLSPLITVTSFPDRAMISRFSTYEHINPRMFYFAFNLKASAGDEVFALSIGRIYWGWYKSDGLCFGWIDDNEALRGFGEEV